MKNEKYNRMADYKEISRRFDARQVMHDKLRHGNSPRNTLTGAHIRVFHPSPPPKFTISYKKSVPKNL